MYSKPRHLVQFAIMAEALAKNVLKVNEPRVGLLSIGEEQGKGNAQVNEAFSLLKRTTLNFSGNVEGRDMFDGTLDIAVCDGFVGNVILKMSEGWGKTISGLLRQELKTGFWSKMGSFLSVSAFKRFSQRLDYEEYGGGSPLGTQRIRLYLSRIFRAGGGPERGGHYFHLYQQPGQRRYPGAARIASGNEQISPL